MYLPEELNEFPNKYLESESLIVRGFEKLPLHRSKSNNTIELFDESIGREFSGKYVVEANRLPFEENDICDELPQGNG
ncbi:MAG: hypothetical protein BWY67_02025 [Bacteroidetes bacterium ADurb.Bin397]|nr:MAG: hypothetical protein BWY67_02025 [Bacteroidetes bacterium ADurb.Bin397]